MSLSVPTAEPDYPVYELMPPGTTLYDHLTRTYTLEEGSKGNRTYRIFDFDSALWVYETRLPMKVSIGNEHGSEELKDMHLWLNFENETSNFGLLKTKTNPQGTIRSHTFKVAFTGFTKWDGVEPKDGEREYEAEQPGYDLLGTLDGIRNIRGNLSQMTRFFPDLSHEPVVLAREMAQLDIKHSFGDNTVPVHFVLTLDPEEGVPKSEYSTPVESAIDLPLVESTRGTEGV